MSDPLRYNGRMKSNTALINQLELTLPQTPIARRRPRRGTGRERARWWFSRMHRLVDEGGSDLAAVQPVLRLG